MNKDVAIITGNVSLTANTEENVAADIYQRTSWTENYPTGFTNSNCIVLSFMGSYDSKYWYGSMPDSSASAGVVSGAIPRVAGLDSNNISCFAYNMSTSTKTLYYKIVLLKIN